MAPVATPIVVVDYDLYVCPAESAALVRHLALRDLLRVDGEAAAAYADLKRTLAVRFRHDRSAYTDAKSAFIEALLAGRP